VLKTKNITDKTILKFIIMWKNKQPPNHHLKIKKYLKIRIRLNSNASNDLILILKLIKLTPTNTWSSSNNIIYTYITNVFSVSVLDKTRFFKLDLASEILLEKINLVIQENLLKRMESVEYNGSV
jgi:hypothetical protein